MSATNRGAERAICDYYPTPSWCVDRLLDRIGLRLLGLGRRNWLEPAVGDGAIMRAVASWCEARGLNAPNWTTVDLRAEVVSDVCGDFTGLARPLLDAVEPLGGFDVVLTNPPFREALEFVHEAIYRASVVAMLLRLSWLASAERAPWIAENVPSVYVLPDRPSFDGEGTDATDYAWLVWGAGFGRTLEILDVTPLRERRPR